MSIAGRETHDTHVTPNSPITVPKRASNCPQMYSKIKMHADFKGDFFTQVGRKRNSVTHW